MHLRNDFKMLLCAISFVSKMFHVKPHAYLTKLFPFYITNCLNQTNLIALHAHVTSPANELERNWNKLEKKHRSVQFVRLSHDFVRETIHF